MINSIEKEFAPAEESIDWAKGAVDELDALIRKFFDENSAAIVSEFDPDTLENVRKVVFRSEVPNSLRRKATEALVNARHSFDQTVFAARNVLIGRSAKGVNYPWSCNPKDLDGHLKRREIDTRIWDTIRTHQPYPTSEAYSGGDDLCRTLATVANNKHTVGLSVNPTIMEAQSPSMRGGGGTFKMFEPRWNPEKKEAELVRWTGNCEFGDDYKFGFQICLEDARLPQPMDAIWVLHYFAHKATEACKTIKAKCVEITR